MRSLFQLDARHGRDGLRPLSTQAERFKSASSIAAVQEVGAGENSTSSAEMLVSPVGRTLNPPSQPGAGDHSKSFFPAKRSHEHVIAAGIESPGPLLFIRYSRGDDQLSRPSGQIPRTVRQFPSGSLPSQRITGNSLRFRAEKAWRQFCAACNFQFKL